MHPRGKSGARGWETRDGHWVIGDVKARCTLKDMPIYVERVVTEDDYFRTAYIL